MSLETQLELNNTLLARQNALLEQLLAQGKKVVSVEQEAIPATAVVPVVTEADLTFDEVIALAHIAPHGAITQENLDAVREYNTAQGTERNEQIDAAIMALKGVPSAPSLYKEVLRGLAGALFQFWEELPGIEERRTFAKKWLSAPPGDRGSVKPDKSKATDKRKGPFFFKNPISGDFGTSEEHDDLLRVQADGWAEITKVEYLQLKEDAEASAAKTGGEPVDAAALLEQGKTLIIKRIAPKSPAELRQVLDGFGLKKLTEATDEQLPAVIAALESLADKLEA